MKAPQFSSYNKINTYTPPFKKNSAHAINIEQYPNIIDNISRYMANGNIK
jgi:hypothetical protein